MDARLAEDPLQRVSLEFEKLVIEADLAAEQSFNVFDRCTDQFDLEEDDTADAEVAPPTVRQRRSQSMQLPAGGALSGIRGAFRQMKNRTCGLPSDPARSVSTPERMMTSDFVDASAAEDGDSQETAQSQVVRRAKVGIAGATKLCAGWLRKLPRSKVHVQYDDCSLWKRRYVTLVRQNRRGPFWKDALLVYHKSDESGRYADETCVLMDALVR